MRSGTALLVIGFSSAAAWAQQQGVIRSETKVVLVDAVVTDKRGGYVHDLSAKDFRVWEDGKEQTIQSFSVESAAAYASSATPQARYMILMFDYGGMDAADQIRARQAAAPFIDANAGPDHLMAIANLEAGLSIAQSFTGNAGRLKDAVNGAKSGILSVNNSRAGTSASADLGTRDIFLALKRLATNLSSVPGRKTIVLLTGSLVASTAQKAALTSAIEECNRANVAVYPVDVRDVSLPSNFEAETAAAPRGGRGVGNLSNRGRTNNMAGDADPGVTADPTGANQEVLFSLASGTGGFVIRNAGELPGGLFKIGQEQQQYYVLSYTPPESKETACHALRVKVNRGGVMVRARSSYCSEKQPDLLTKNASEKNLEQHATGDAAGNLAATMRLPFFYAGAGVARVNLAMEIGANSLKLDRRKPSPREVNVLGIATTADGNIAARFTDAVTLNIAGVDLAPLHYQKEFKIAPGRYTFTLAFSAGTESFGKLEQPLAIEPHEAGQLALSGIALGKEVRKGTAAEAPFGADLFTDHTPLIVGGVELIPTGSRNFNKSDPVYCYFEIYDASATEPPAIGMRILNANTSDVVWDGGTGTLDVSGGKLMIPAGLKVPISMLEPGSYVLEVTAASKNTIRRIVSFQIK